MLLTTEENGNYSNLCTRGFKPASHFRLCCVRTPEHLPTSASPHPHCRTVLSHHYCSIMPLHNPAWSQWSHIPDTAECGQPKGHICVAQESRLKGVSLFLTRSGRCMLLLQCFLFLYTKQAGFWYCQGPLLWASAHCQPRSLGSCVCIHRIVIGLKLLHFYRGPLRPRDKICKSRLGWSLANSAGADFGLVSPIGPLSGVPVRVRAKNRSSSLETFYPPFSGF